MKFAFFVSVIVIARTGGQKARKQHQKPERDITASLFFLLTHPSVRIPYDVCTVRGRGGGGQKKRSVDAVSVRQGFFFQTISISTLCSPR